MTTAQINTVIDTHRLSDVEAAELEHQIGCLVVMLSVGGSKPMMPPIRVDDHAEACRIAVTLKYRGPKPPEPSGAGPRSRILVS